MRVISLGWGVQSFALAAMSALGVLPKVDVAIHADTTYERSETYEFARRWTPWLEERGVKVITVTGHRNGAVLDEWGGVFIPAYTAYEDGRPSGMLRRQCTGDWKIAPIRRWIREQTGHYGENDYLPYLMAMGGGNELARLLVQAMIAEDGALPQVEMWLGITLDEIKRMKPSGVQWMVNRFPFLELLDRPWTRHDAMRWMQEQGLEIPVKSSCVFCPYHNRATWREIKMAGNGDWQRAVDVDEAIRHKRPGYVAYVHRDRVPLEEVDVRNQEDHGQLSLFDDAECEGMCFL